ncbi:hypothetical protein QJS10_CPB15g01990 [Acorus calamus]|uniref:GTPase HflX N-terminal domain-containing protein n=1 Tax=Acorus calamus TaxID=4465 RepID=A0AAV9DAV2_ACOCL|nr:hypothetical protein QJS10_CPB15g01990 [Acorus calamus]
MNAFSFTRSVAPPNALSATLSSRLQRNPNFALNELPILRIPSRRGGTARNGVVGVLKDSATEFETGGGLVSESESDVRVDGDGVVEVEPVRVPKRSKRKVGGDNDGEERFRLRNGREVLEEKHSFGIEESLKELEQLADTAGLSVVGSTYQKLANPNPRTYIGSGKVAEIRSAIHALDVETVIFDDELPAGNSLARWE